MNLTEPQAGSDLSAVRTRAVPQYDGSYRSLVKIFITYGEHELEPKPYSPRASQNAKFATGRDRDLAFYRSEISGE